MKMWRKEVLRQLRSSDAPRVVTTSMMLHISAKNRPNVNESSVISLIKEAEDFGIFHRVRNGIFLNLQAIPSPQYAEAAQLIRSGSVVSLHSVLGDSGVINNPTEVVFSVVPFSKDKSPPRVGMVKAQGATFCFHALPERILSTGEEKDRLDVNFRYPRATNEAALCHWFYLGSSPHSKMTLPPFDIDVEDIDRDRLDRLSAHIGIKDKLNEWLEDVENKQKDTLDYDESFGF